MVKERPAVLCGKAVIIEALVREPVQIKVQQRHETLLAVNNFITQLPFEPFNVIEDTDSEFSNVTTHENRIQQLLFVAICPDIFPLIWRHKINATKLRQMLEQKRFNKLGQGFPHLQAGEELAPYPIYCGRPHCCVI